jgi:hypothetical protein
MINPYKQTICNGCLVASLLMVIKDKYNVSYSKKDEGLILIKGGDRSKYQFYVSGIPIEFYKKFKKKINLVVDNKYFTNVLLKEFNNKSKFNVYQSKITLELIKSLVEKGPIVCHIDDNLLGDYSHASHFIVIEKVEGNRVQIVDPWYGKRRVISLKKLEEAIKSLKTHIKMCPLIFYM